MLFRFDQLSNPAQLNSIQHISSLPWRFRAGKDEDALSGFREIFLPQ
jgi:hypothetical protein